MGQEKQPLKVYYSIGEVADMFGVNTSLIRFWEKEFDVIKPHKNKKGNRQFTKADIDNFSPDLSSGERKRHDLAGGTDETPGKQGRNRSELRSGQTAESHSGRINSDQSPAFLTIWLTQYFITLIGLSGQRKLLL